MTSRVPSLYRHLTLAVALLACLAVVVGSERSPTPIPSAPGFPVHAAFYYPWYPETEHWATHYHPVAGRYESGDESIVEQHVLLAERAGLDAFIASWWGAGSPTGRRLPLLLAVAGRLGFGVAPYYEPAGQTPAPTGRQLSYDFDYLGTLTNLPGWLHVHGRPVLFVYNAARSVSCRTVDQLITAAAGRFYLSLKVFPGFSECRRQPDSWHQYNPAVPYTLQRPYSATVSPGFFKFDETQARLPRDLTRFRRDLERQVDDRVQWDLVTTFNEWGEGTAVEPAREWTGSGAGGSYLQAIRAAYLPSTH